MIHRVNRIALAVALACLFAACGRAPGARQDVSCLILAGTWLEPGSEIRAQDGRRIGSVGTVEPDRLGVRARLALEPDIFVPPHAQTYVERLEPGHDVLVIHLPKNPTSAMRASHLVTQEIRGAQDPGWWLELPR